MRNGQIIGICGIKRSASTAMYNLIRIALNEADYNVIPFGHDYNPNRPPQKGEAYLCKRHPFDQRLANEADHIFLTDRNNQDILRSLDRMWNSGNPERLDHMRKQLDKWKQYTDQDHIYQYKDFINAGDYMMSKIICVLGLPFLDVNVIVNKFEQIELPENKQDPVTLLFPNHISK